MNRQRLLDRFLRYVKIDTTSSADSDTYPSTPGQLDLGKVVADEMRLLGVSSVSMNTHGIVIGTLPSNVDKDVPVVAFNSHFDTSPETTGKNVKPSVIESYAGGDIQLAGDPTKIITVAENPELNDLLGATLITTDGTTLLGGDDKAGIAIIMEMANHLIENPELKHGEIRMLFTCDEEIGHGIDHVNVAELNATACYTLDGGGKGIVDVETFSADGALIRIEGVNIHPSIGRDRMVNAIRAAAEIVSQMPMEQSPERTDERDGFLHPYVIRGGVDEVTVHVLLRSFDTPELAVFAEQLEKVCADVESKTPGSKITLEITKQYRNLADGLKKDPRVVDFAIKAHERLGLDVKKTIIRGGTDGSGLTEMGLPTPNLSSGQHNIHSPMEWACLDEMEEATRVCLELVQIWAEGSC